MTRSSGDVVDLDGEGAWRSGSDVVELDGEGVWRSGGDMVELDEEGHGRAKATRERENTGRQRQESGGGERSP
jgi:hypothetical protein